jgi:hypothetical protein
MMETPAWTPFGAVARWAAREMVAAADPEPPRWAVGRGPARRLLGGGFDLMAEENQVYLFMVVFGAVLFGTPPLVKFWRMCFKGTKSTVQEVGVDQELWDFQDEFPDLKHVHDPLDGDADKGKKKQRRGMR